MLGVLIGTGELLFLSKLTEPGTMCVHTQIYLSTYLSRVCVCSIYLYIVKTVSSQSYSFIFFFPLSVVLYFISD